MMTRLVFVLLFSLAVMSAQTSSSQIGGAVRDASGAVVPDARCLVAIRAAARQGRRYMHGAAPLLARETH